MAVVAVDFVHFDREHHRGDVIPDDDPLVELAPHLFIQLVEPEQEPSEPVRLGREGKVAKPRKKETP